MLSWPVVVSAVWPTKCTALKPEILIREDRVLVVICRKEDDFFAQLNQGSVISEL